MPSLRTVLKLTLLATLLGACSSDPKPDSDAGDAGLVADRPEAPDVPAARDAEPPDYSAPDASAPDAQPVIEHDPPKSWRATFPMNVARARHAAALLPSGKVVVIGGQQRDHTPIASVEVWDPSDESWTEVAQLPEGRTNHTATVLLDGRVLIAGGGDSSMVGLPANSNILGTSLLLDPVTYSLTPTGDLKVPRSFHSAVLLQNGQVLVMGGASHNNAGGPDSPSYLDSAELYDPSTGAWTLTGALAEARAAATLTRLPSGKVLAVAGANETVSLASAELYDPALGTWSPAASLWGDRFFHAATLLDSGRLLIACGKKSNVAFLGSSATYDETTGEWTRRPSSYGTSTLPALVGLSHDRALLAGGNYCDLSGCRLLANAAVFDGATNRWSPIERLLTARVFHTATVLADGNVLIAGGLDNNDEVLARAELSAPTWTGTGTPTPTCLRPATLPIATSEAGYLGTGANAPPSDTTYSLFRSTAGTPHDLFRVQLFHRTGTPRELALPIQRSFDSSSLQATCDVCVSMLGNCNATSCATRFLAIGGSIEVRTASKSAGAGRFNARARGVRLWEWTYNAAAGVDEPVPGGQCIDVPDTELDARWP